MDSCKCCYSSTNDFVLINKYPCYSGIDIAINRQGMLRARTYQYDGEDTFESQDIVQMNYCPLCGRKFVGGQT